jgi:cytochrome c oxidase cbb3-type subunit 4
MSHAEVSTFAQTWGLVFLVVMFVVAVAYALWPKNKKKFDRAAQLPLDDDDKPEEK